MLHALDTVLAAYNRLEMIQNPSKGGEGVLQPESYKKPKINKIRDM